MLVHITSRQNKLETLHWYRPAKRELIHELIHLMMHNWIINSGPNVFKKSRYISSLSYVHGYGNPVEDHNLRTGPYR